MHKSVGVTAGLLNFCDITTGDGYQTLTESLTTEPVHEPMQVIIHSWTMRWARIRSCEDFDFDSLLFSSVAEMDSDSDGIAGDGRSFVARDGQEFTARDG